MNPQELYEILDKAGVDYEVIEIFEGSRLIRVEVDDNDELKKPKES